LLLAFLLPLTVFLCVHILAPPFGKVRRWRERVSRRRHQRRQEQRRQQEQEEYERQAPHREKARCEEAAAQKRRADARARCELFYSLHAPEIGVRFPKDRFDDFASRHLGDNHPPEYVEERARQVLDIMQKHLEKIEPPKKALTLADLAVWFLREKAQIDATALGEEDKALLLAQLEERYTKLQEKYLRSVQP
jgi:hypothetical protein